MGGIAGVLRRDGGGVPEQVRRQVATLAHRGDIVSFRDQGPATLASLRRHTDTAGSAGADDLVVVADARLDDQAALLRELGVQEPAPAVDDGGDARVILEAYRRWGDGCAAHLSGDFAFAVWDGPARSLYLARDRTGVKQLYLRVDGPTVAFGSEIRAVLAVDGVSRRLNRAAVAYHLLDVMEDQEVTLFADVSRLPPAHWLRVEPGGPQRGCYWALDPGRETRMAGDDEYAEAYRSALEAAVAGRLRAGGSVGAMLSGGLDSSSIAGSARRLQGGQTLPVFNGVFGGLVQSPDTSFVEALLGQGGFQAHRVLIASTGPLSVLAPDADDEPLRAPGVALQLGLYTAAREAGCVAILDGDGGDDAVSHGMARLAELARAGRAGALVREARAVRRRTGVPIRSTLVTWGLRPLLPEAALRVRRALLGRDPSGAALATPLNPGFARAIDLRDRLEVLARVASGVPRTAREEHFRLLTTGLTAHSLGVLDRVAARVPIEPRYPFLDHRLLELCLALPADQKLSDGWTRVVARRAMKGILPDPVRWRGGKAPMSGAMVSGLQTTDAALLDEVIEGDGPIWEFVDRDRARRLKRVFRERADPGSALILWLIGSTELWLRSQAEAA